jgi:hypothetical protein
MVCIRCGKATLQVHCDRCFVEICGRRIRRNVKTGKRAAVFDDLSERLLSRPGLELVRLKQGSFGIRRWDLSVFDNRKLQGRLHSTGLVAYVPVTMDAFLKAALEELFTGKRQKKWRLKRIVPLLLEWTSEDLERYSEIMGLPYRSSSKGFIDTLEARYPGTKRSMLGSLKTMGAIR